jgi:hypothetical protein
LLKWLITNWYSFIVFWAPMANTWSTNPVFH